MRQMLWLVLIAAIAGIAYLCWQAVRKWDARRRAEDARFAAFMAQARPPSSPPPPAVAPVPAPASSLAQEKLLFEAAAKAADAGEAALSIQLYERLLARYPSSAFAAQASAAIEAQKRRLGNG